MAIDALIKYFKLTNEDEVRLSEIMSDCCGDDEYLWQVLDRLRCNEPGLKYLYLYISISPDHAMVDQITLAMFEAIETNSSLEILEIGGETITQITMGNQVKRVQRALSLNASIKDICVTIDISWRNAFDIVLASPNLEALTIR